MLCFRVLLHCLYGIYAFTTALWYYFMYIQMAAQRVIGLNFNLCIVIENIPFSEGSKN